MVREVHRLAAGRGGPVVHQARGKGHATGEASGAAAPQSERGGLRVPVGDAALPQSS